MQFLSPAKVVGRAAIRPPLVIAFAIGAFLLAMSGSATAHDLLSRPSVGTRIDNTCDAVSPAPPFDPPPAGYVRKYNTLAHKFLDEEVGAGGVTLAMYAILDALIDEAKAALKPYSRSVQGAAERQFAAESLLAMDCILLRHGFVYPGTGLVQLLSDGLEPTRYDDATYFAQLKGQSHNIRRRKFIEHRGAGPYYVVDCDIASFIYLAIAEVMGFPLSLVDIPRHNFVRWHFSDGGYVNFETMDGFQTDDQYYKVKWFIPDAFVGRGGILQSMDQAKTLAYHQASVALAWSWKGNVDRMKEFYLRSIATDSAYVFALNNLAWFYAAAPKKEWRDGAAAVKYATLAVANLPDGDSLDTLACAYAQMGDFKRAIEAEEMAIKVAYAPFGSDLMNDLKLFKAQPPQTCNDLGFGVDPFPFRPHRPSRPFSVERSLQRLH